MLGRKITQDRKSECWAPVNGAVKEDEKEAKGQIWWGEGKSKGPEAGWRQACPIVPAAACRPGKPSRKEGRRVGGNQPIKLGELGVREAQRQCWLSAVRGRSLSLSRLQISCLHNEGLGGILLSHLGFCHLTKMALLLPWNLERQRLHCKGEEHRLWNQGI